MIKKNIYIKPKITIIIKVIIRSTMIRRMILVEIYR